jgi:hypothetical protein
MPLLVVWFSESEPQSSPTFRVNARGVFKSSGVKESFFEKDDFF